MILKQKNDFHIKFVFQDSDDLHSRDDASHRAVFGDDIDEEELLGEIGSETNPGKSGSDDDGEEDDDDDDDDDSEGPDQVDSDEQMDLLETKEGKFYHSYEHHSFELI
jgi:hypothetical protein